MARLTHEVVVGRAVLVLWNPPAATQSKTFHGFCASCSFPQEATRRFGGGPWQLSERRTPSRAGAPRLGGPLHPLVGRCGSGLAATAGPTQKNMTQTALPLWEEQRVDGWRQAVFFVAAGSV